MRSMTRAACMLMLLVSCLVQRDAMATVPVPILYEDARVYVPVRVGALPAQWFILDTGASRTILDTAVARAAHLRVSDGRMVQGAGGGSSQQKEAAAVELHVGEVALAVAAPAVMDLAHLLGPTSGRAPAGIIGAQFFREHFVQIDFALRTLTVSDQDDVPRGTFTAAVPLTFVAGTPLATVLLTLPGGRTLRAHALVDLGAKSSFLIPEPFIDQTGMRTAFPQAVVTGFGAGVGGDTFYAFARAERLALADAPDVAQAKPIVGLSVGGTLRSTWHEGLLGAEFLAPYVVGFDYQHARLLLSAGGGATAGFDRSGLFLIAAGAQLSRIVVRQVIKGGPGDAAGLKPNDELLQIDGTPAAALGLAGVRTRLKDAAAASVMLRYLRGREQLTATVRLRDLL